MNTEQINERLDVIEGYEADWDGLGANKPSAWGLARLRNMLWALSDPSRIVAAPDGSICVERQSPADDKIVYVEFDDEDIDVEARRFPKVATP